MPEPPVTTQPVAVPLCVDLDGTVLRTDVFWESFVRLLRRNPLYLLSALIWWCRGRAVLKREIARRVEVPAETLPRTESLLDHLRAERAARRPILLVTAADERLARRVAGHLNLFDEVLASDGHTNLRGATKARQLVERFGRGGYDYAGNSRTDLAVWRQARRGIVVNGTPALVRRAARVTMVSRTFDCAPARWRALWTVLRPHQWFKNLIVFVPLLTSHTLFDGPALAGAAWAAAAFCLCASAAYVLNDLLDLDHDRQHPTRRARPLASGELPLPVGLALVPALFAGGLLVAWMRSAQLAMVLAAYVACTTAYSWRLKQVPLLDAFMLAGFYIIRLAAGHAATGIAHSVWLLVFAMFLFLSLALVKRFRELQGLRQRSQTNAAGRGYLADDLELVAALGTSSGYLAALVLALYVNSQEVRALYAHPTLLLLGCPLLLFWVSRVWLIAHRGQMHDDPVLFALKDRPSYLIGALMLVIVWLAAGR